MFIIGVIAYRKIYANATRYLYFFFFFFILYHHVRCKLINFRYNLSIECIINTSSNFIYFAFDKCAIQYYDYVFKSYVIESNLTLNINQ